MKITLITDSTCDISPEVLEERGIKFAPLKVLFPDGEYVDKLDLTNAEFYEKMKSSPSLPTTSQVNPNEFYDLFTEELKKGNTVLGLFISSELSGTFNSASIAKDMIGEGNITLLDSRTTSFGLAMLVHKVQDFIDQGLPLDEIITKAQAAIDTSQLYGMLDTLENLKKGGRLSSSSAMIGKMLNLKPIIQVENGLVNVASKARGSKKGMNWMLEQLLSVYPDGKVDEIGLAHANSTDKLETLKAMLFESIEAKKVYEIEIGSVVGAHTGEGAVGIVFYRK